MLSPNQEKPDYSRIVYFAYLLKPFLGISAYLVLELVGMIEKNAKTDCFTSLGVSKNVK